MEWHWDPNPEDDLVQVEFSILLRKHQEVVPIHESHQMLVLALGRWMQLFAQAQLIQEFPATPWFGGGEFFLLSSMNDH